MEPSLLIGNMLMDDVSWKQLVAVGSRRQGWVDSQSDQGFVFTFMVLQPSQFSGQRATWLVAAWDGKIQMVSSPSPIPTWVAKTEIISCVAYNLLPFNTCYLRQPLLSAWVDPGEAAGQGENPSRWSSSHTTNSLWHSVGQDGCRA